jgi:hypothetical protein
MTQPNVIIRQESKVTKTLVVKAKEIREFLRMRYSLPNDARFGVLIGSACNSYDLDDDDVEIHVSWERMTSEQTEVAIPRLDEPPLGSRPKPTAPSPLKVGTRK